MSRHELKESGIVPRDAFRTVKQPRTFSHYVMNLPSTAIDFLPSFIGLYAGHENVYQGSESWALPMIHCYCFAGKSEGTEDSEVMIQKEICSRLSEKLGHVMNYDDKDIKIHEVRAVAPNKRQYCASFRLPAEVAFRTSVG